MKKGDWVKYVRKSDRVERWHELVGDKNSEENYPSYQRWASDGYDDKDPIEEISVTHYNDAWTREIIPTNEVPDYVLVGFAKRMLTE